MSASYLGARWRILLLLVLEQCSAPKTHGRRSWPKAEGINSEIAAPCSPGLMTIVMNAASGLPVEKRTVFLERVAARLALRGARISDADLDKAIRIALKGLVHNSAA